MRDKRIILCDADDTIENLCQTWVTYLNRMYGTTVHSSEIVDWNVSLFFPSLTKEQVYDPIFNKNFWKEINPIDGCYKRFLKQLTSEMNCTSSQQLTIKLVIQRLKEYLKCIRFSNGHNSLLQKESN